MNREARPIIITGFMGAGKTTVARALAERLNCGMIDLDQLITERFGRNPQKLIDEEGERKFRELESESLRDALRTVEAGVIGLGGGTWTIEGNRALIAESQGLTIWLDAPFELCWRRIENGTGARPLARNREQAQMLYDERRALYLQAGWRIPVTERESPRAIAELIIAALPEQTRGR